MADDLSPYKRQTKEFDWTPKKSEHRKRSKSFPPTQMSKWFNTTSGFVCGVFGGFLIVTLSAAITAAVGFLVFIVGYFVIGSINYSNCVSEYETEYKTEASDSIKEECRVKVGLGRSDGKDRGYWR